MDLTKKAMAGKSKQSFALQQWPLTAKIVRIMKLSTFILLCTFLTASAGGYSQRVTMTLKDAPIEKAFREIQKQTGYDFLFTRQMLKNALPVNIDVKDASLQEVLNLCLKGQPLGFTIENNAIVINSKIETEQVQLPPPPIDVKGRVLNEKGEPVASASVQVKGNKTKGTVTDANGYFELNGVDDKATIIVSAVNIETVERKLNGKTEITITARIKIAVGDDINIASNGYQKIPKERATGSFEVITAKQLQHSNDPNLLKRLEGITTSMVFNNKVPGNQIYTNTSDPNADQRKSALNSLTIRGKNTLNSKVGEASVIYGYNDSGVPLVVIDGVPSPYSIENVNPDIVETITILKDAAAASIWGSRAANGVIVITTKKRRLRNQSPSVLAAVLI